MWMALGILAFAIATRLVYVLAFPVTFRNGFGCFGDTHTYLTLAHNLGKHHVFSQSLQPPFVPSAYKPPLYSAFLAGLFQLGITSPASIRVVQAVLGGFSALFVFLSAWWITGRRIEAVCAGLLAALCPYMVHYTRNLLSDWLGVFLFSAFLAVTVRSLVHKRAHLAALAGLLLGLTILVRPVMLPFALGSGILYLCTRQWRLRQRIVAASLCVLTCAAVVGVWSARNYAVLGKFVAVSAGGMPVGLLRGTWETEKNWSWTAVPEEFFTTTDEETYAKKLVESYTLAADKGDMGFLFRLNKQLKALAFKRIGEAPERYLSLCVGRLPILWWNHHIPMYLEQDPPGGFVYLYLVGGLLALPLLRFSRYRRGPMVLLFMVPVYVTLMHLPAHCEPRFTLPAMPALSILAGLGFAAAFRHFRPGPAERDGNP